MATNEELQAELAELRAEVRALRGALAPAVTVDEPRLLSRRNLLRVAPVAAIGAGIAAMSATPAAAAPGDPVLLGQVNDDGTGTTTITGGTPYEATDTGVDATKPTALQVNGGVGSDWGTFGGVLLGGLVGPNLAVQVQGDSRQFGLAQFVGDVDAEGRSVSGGNAVAINVVGPGAGVSIDAEDGDRGSAGPDEPALTYPGIGLAVSTATGPALAATSQGNAIAVKSTDAAQSADAVTVSYAGKKHALYAESTATTNAEGTITGVNDGAGFGVWGENRSATADGAGLVGKGGAKGRGAQLTGGLAQLRLVPGLASSHPWGGKQGDFFVDHSARLWFCQKANTSSVPAVWKQLA